MVEGVLRFKNSKTPPNTRIQVEDHVSDGADSASDTDERRGTDN